MIEGATDAYYYYDYFEPDYYQPPEYYYNQYFTKGAYYTKGISLSKGTPLTKGTSLTKGKGYSSYKGTCVASIQTERDAFLLLLEHAQELNQISFIFFAQRTGKGKGYQTKGKGTAQTRNFRCCNL